jgi:cytoskeletal protein CcmA (bactofilin family)
MASTTFSGPVTSTNGFIGSVTGTVTGAVVATTVSASGNATLSGTANVIIIPTTDPGVAGAIWNDAGTLSVSAGA